MTAELVFTVEGSAAVRAEPIHLAAAGLRERRDLQEWVLAHPEILGSEVKVVGFEFDRWATRDGGRQLDRLDVLGLDSDGRLVVAELKRDRAPDTVHLQAINYAALASRFTEDTLVEHYCAFRRRRGAQIDETAAREELLDHAGELDADLLRRPRIVLVAGSYPITVTATVVWLAEMGVDVTVQRVQAYRVYDDRTLITVSQLFPVADVEEFTVSPQRAEARAAVERGRRRREGSSVVRLVRSGELADGTPLELRPVADDETRAALEAWVAEDPRRGRARWFNDRTAPLEWEATGERARPTPIVQKMLAELGISATVRGPKWWALPDGRDLATAARDVGQRSGRFDWGDFHDVLRAMPSGRWTTYGDLAQLVGTEARPVGQHIARCGGCANVQRVLDSNGRQRPNFAWHDPADTRTQQEALEAEGVRFTGGVADPAQRIDVDGLAELLGE